MSKPSLKNFNPNRIALLELEMWKAYYAHNYIQLLQALYTMLKEQFHFGGLKALLAAYYSTRAAFIFKQTHTDNDNMAIGTENYLQKFYSCVHSNVSEKFLIEEVAKRELVWWYVHRYPSRYKTNLHEALAEGIAPLYNVPVRDVLEYGKHRAEAMHKRDQATHVEAVVPDWKAIETDLQAAYHALYKALNS